MDEAISKQIVNVSTVASHANDLKYMAVSTIAELRVSIMPHLQVSELFALLTSLVSRLERPSLGFALNSRDDEWERLT